MGRVGPVWVFAAAISALYSWLAITKHDRFATGMDLAIFSQAADHLARGEPPYSPIKGADYVLWGDHLHPIIVVLALPWRLWGDPRSLLIAQALLIALAVAIVGHAAVRRLGTGWGMALTGALGLSIGVQAAALFDVHEVAIGSPLVALAGADLVRGRHRRAAMWVALFPLIKEDMAVIMLGFALTLAVLGARRLAAALAVWSVAALWLALKVIIPAINPRGVYPYDGQISTHPSHLVDSLVTDGTGRLTVIVLIAGAGFLLLRSPLVFLAAAPIGFRMLSSNPSHWGLDFHYSLLPALLLTCAAVDGFARTRSTRWRQAAIAAALAVTVWMLATGPVSDAIREDAHGCERCSQAQAAIDEIPPGAEVAVDDRLAPHLVRDREVAHITANYWLDDPRRPEWMILDRQTGNMANARGRDWVSEHLVRAQAEGYQVVRDEGGFVVLHRR